MPKIDISVIIPLYNRVALVAQTISSVQSQTYLHWEALIIDDGSTDGSMELVEKISKEDARIKVLKRNRHPKGAPVCRNIGLEHASGEYVIFLDSDDLLAPFCLERRFTHISDLANVDFMVFPMLLFKNRPGDMDILWNIDNEREDDLARFLRLDALWQTSCPIYRRTSLLKIGGFDEDLPFLQDYELHVRTLCAKFVYVKQMHVEPDCFLRRHEGESISQKGFDTKKSFLDKEMVYRKILKTLLAYHRKEYILYVSSLFFNLSKKWLQKYGDLNRSLACWENIHSILETDLYYKSMDYLEKLNQYYQKGNVSVLLEINKIEKSIPLIFSHQNHNLNLITQSNFTHFNTKKPFFSIVIPENAQINNLSLLLKQVFNQTYPYFEVLIINPCLTEDSRKVIENYALQEKQIKIIYHEQDTKDIREQLNKAIEQTKGEYIWLVDTPDFLDNTFLADVIGYLTRCSHTGLIYYLGGRNSGLCNWNGYAGYKDETNWSDSFYKNGERIVKKLLFVNNNLPAPDTVLFDKNVYKAASRAYLNSSLNSKWLLYSHILLYGDILFVSKLSGPYDLQSNTNTQVTYKPDISIKELSEILLSMSRHFLIKPDIRKRIISSFVNIWQDVNKLGAIPFRINFAIYRNLSKADHSTSQIVLMRLIKNFIRTNIPIRFVKKRSPK
ncbi:glycosyltransferase [Rhodocytophaga rosea]|uniref:Glycosyltransferase n=1 Tax=Rhodocytophaga rosea TaxID=2704465 RepID=A0A6C0GNI6_9BACT|nr:glycosyltransferase [Rhodocytophaga rosea]QHT69596.1 glycosyltransferase [Rhodocytophaga rosea]